MLAQQAFEVLKDYSSCDSVRATLFVNAAVNTGWKSGFVVKLENVLGRILHATGCTLHQNELPFRNLL